jgi:hypothetical protein
MASPSLPQPGPLIPRAVLLFLLLLLGLFGAYVGSALLLADALVLRHPTRAGVLHPSVLVNGVLSLVIAYTVAAGWIGQRWVREDFEALRPVVDAGERDWEDWTRVLVHPPRGPLLWGSVLGALFGLAVIGLALSVVTRGPTVWAGHHLWSWILNPALFATIGVFALRGSEANRVFAAMGERARVGVGANEALTPFARAGLRRALLWLLGSSLAALLLPATGQPALVLAIIALTLGLGVTSLFAPSRTLHRRMREKKQAELAWVRSEIDRAGDALRGFGDPARGSRLPALIAWEARVADAPTWPFDVSTKLRFALLLLVPLGSWLGGAMVERLLASFLGG